MGMRESWNRLLPVNLLLRDQLQCPRGNRMKGLFVLQDREVSRGKLEIFLPSPSGCLLHVHYSIPHSTVDKMIETMKLSLRLRHPYDLLQCKSSDSRSVAVRSLLNCRTRPRKASMSSPIRLSV